MITAILSFPKSGTQVEQLTSIIQALDDCCFTIRELEVQVSSIEVTVELEHNSFEDGPITDAREAEDAIFQALGDLEAGVLIVEGLTEFDGNSTDPAVVWGGGHVVLA